MKNIFWTCLNVSNRLHTEQNLESIVQARWNWIEMCGHSGAAIWGGGGGPESNDNNFWITVTKQLDLFINKKFDLYNI